MCDGACRVGSSISDPLKIAPMVGGIETVVAATPLLETKLYVPRRRGDLVLRPRLSERLSRASQSKLTLVSAPAGFGKTTLLTQCLAAAPLDDLPAAWLSL